MSDSRNWADYFDQNGLPCQLNKDGGDSAQRLGMLWVAARIYIDEDWLAPITPPFDLMGNFPDMVNKIQVSPGIFIRNPINYNQVNDFSRDQQQSLVMAMGMWAPKGSAVRQALTDMFWQHVKRFGKYQNADWAGPENLGQYIRAFDAKWAYPVLWFTDLFMVGSVIVRVVTSHIDINNVSDDLNTTLELLQAQRTMATPLSWIARKLYKLRVNGIQWALDWYFRNSTGAPPMNELYRPVIKDKLQ